MGHFFRHNGLILTALIATLSSATAAAQVTAVVYDYETRCCVPGVSVYINPRGSVMTDAYGRFTIWGECNSVTFTHVSYERLSVYAGEIADTVWLLPKERRIDEVIIYGRKPKLGFDLRQMYYGYRPLHGGQGGIGGFDIFSVFDFKGRKQSKRREKIKEILEKY